MSDLRATRIALTALGVARGMNVDDAMDTACFVTPLMGEYKAFDELIHDFTLELDTIEAESRVVD